MVGVIKISNFDRQLERFYQLGFFTDPKEVKRELLFAEDKSLFENDPFRLMYIYLASGYQREPFKPLTNRCIFLDSECIEDQGIYVELMQEFIRITRGEISINNFEDFLDFDSGKASISFDHRQERICWDLRIDNDWIDMRILDNLVQLSDEINTNGKYSYLLTGQTFVLGYHSKEEFNTLSSLIGKELTWLNREIHPWLEK